MQKSRPQRSNHKAGRVPAIPLPTKELQSAHQERMRRFVALVREPNLRMGHPEISIFWITRPIIRHRIAQDPMITRFFQKLTLRGAVFGLVHGVTAADASPNGLAPMDLRRPSVPLAIHTADDGTLEVDGGMGPVLRSGRAYLASRPVGRTDWNEEFANYRVVASTENQLELLAEFEAFKAIVIWQRETDGAWRFSGHLEATGERPMELARFHYLDGVIADDSWNLLSLRQYELPGRIVKQGETLAAPRTACEKGWGGVYWPRLSDPMHDQPNVAISGDAGMLAVDWNSPGLFVGFAGPGSAFGELGMRTARDHASLYAAVLLDAVRVGPGESRVLESGILAFGDPQDQLRRWARVCVGALGPARVAPPLVGYCSWYQLGQNVQPAEIRRAIQSFASYPTPAGGRTIQIDDGYQVCPGDWTGRGEWREELGKLPKEISDAGFIPGLWIAPTAIHASHPIVREHPEWLQRDADGKPCIRFRNWRSFNGETNADTYFLEPDHPGARQFMVDMLKGLRAQGWRYFKIDFAYTVSSARAKYDPRRTTYESLRDQWRLFRDALGDDAIVNSCNGGAWRYTIGTVDVSRIGGDIGGGMGHLRRNLAEMMLRSHVNGLWFQVDPDVFYLRRENSKLNFEQSHLLTGTQGLLGAAFLTSDFADQWSEPAVQVARRYWNEEGPRVPLDQYLVLQADGLPAAVAVAHGEGEYTIGFYNWTQDVRDVTIGLDQLRLPDSADYRIRPAGAGGEMLTIVDGHLIVPQQPAESLRIFKLQKQTDPCKLPSQ